MERHSDAEKGCVYIVGVKDIDLPVCKIGKTTRDPSLRCAEINKSSTGDFLWEVMHSLTVNDCHTFESLVHAKLVPLRQRGREFFNIHPNDALVAIRSILGSAADLNLVTIAEDERRDVIVPPRNSRIRKQSSRPGEGCHVRASSGWVCAVTERQGPTFRSIEQTGVRRQ